MGLIEDLNGEGSAVHLRRSARARRMSLRVSAVDGRVTLTIPARTSLRTARAFLDQHRGWVENAVAETAPSVTVVPGARLPVEGVDRLLVPSETCVPHLDGDRLLVPISSTGIRVESFVKRLARERLGEAVSDFTNELDVQAGRMTLRDTRSRWGSCSSRGDLMFSWRLVLAPRDVLRYVAAHEVAHLVHMNHSAEFWALTERLFPEQAQARAWLKREGTSLHRYRFREGKS